jgi:hypothetical protein
MKAESNTNPKSFEVESDGTVLLRENITEITKTDTVGTTSTAYQYDEYRITVPFRSNLSINVQSNLASWLSYAKGEISKAELSVTNKTDIVARLKDAIDDNKAYLALTTPTTAQNTAQLKKLCRQNNRIIRYIMAMFDAAD